MNLTLDIVDVVCIITIGMLVGVLILITFSY